MSDSDPGRLVVRTAVGSRRALAGSGGEVRAICGKPLITLAVLAILAFCAAAARQIRTVGRT
ncbi:hypothetical protein GCM10010112_64310 [Actinoplanes lobatus]|uniref:Uncharacterized protein n=1 Tax=Actinoplanes lobatus TaxID=113568 RepID=A0A7W7HN38_9ACTN|nr:hypothetical protein [Actinoplanes lobatus]MBB4753576.1 hypothetical protein [Actinoplanes lobatus]GGN84725.1 hypothetical protein GCM10010112_64310 [Actinoplanes lobatus]GIE38113.1 hypothetical protein Alo02nite_10110 [Actinoplanes lobatus]